MTLWKFEYQLILEGGAVSSHLIAHHDDERIDEIQNRFREFLRGCGYAVSDEDHGTDAYTDELESRIKGAIDYMHDRWDHKPQSVHDFRADLTNMMTLLDGSTE